MEEVEDLGRAQKNKLESYLRQLLKHLLLYQYWESERDYCEQGWIEEIDNFRAELEILVRSKTFKNERDFEFLGIIAHPRAWSNRFTVAALLAALANFGVEGNR